MQTPCFAPPLEGASHLLWREPVFSEGGLPNPALQGREGYD